jgi:activator of HSP90 ATPase
METKTIEQIAAFKATCADVYDMLMNSKKHESLSGEKAEISEEVGGAFTAWGSHIAGLNLILRRGEMIVQAWRAADWPPDHYSTVTFDLRDVAGGCELHFTQIGVPPHRYDGHCRGWMETYWTPMKEILEQGRLSEATRDKVRAAKERIRAGNL